MLIRQSGCQVSSTSRHGGLIVHDDDYGERSILSHLPTHPSARMRAGTAHYLPVLPSDAAPLVTEVLELPLEPDRYIVYVGEAFTPGTGSNPFVRAVWFTSEVADAITGRVRGSHAVATQLVREQWESSDRRCNGAGGWGTQPAGGLYSEMGYGVMPGRTRVSVSVGGAGSVLPFARNAALSDAMEGSLSDFLSDVSMVLHATLPTRCMRAQGDVYGACDEAMMDVYQYPRLRRDAAGLHAHQVVLRCAKRCDDAQADDIRAWEACSDLHVDPWDGGGDLGCCTVHVCSRRAEHTIGDMSEERERHLTLHRGLAVFPHANGGRGVHIRSMVPGWQCALLFRTRECLHGSVLLAKRELAGFGLPQLDMMRVLSYPFSRVERLLRRAAEEPGAWRAIWEGSDSRTRARIWHAASEETRASIAR